MAKLVIMPVAAVLVLLFAGVAQATTCPAGYKDCDKNYYKNGCEVNVRTDVNNCGNCGCKCGPLCGANAIPVCKAAKCEFSCKAPFLNCDGDWKNGCEVNASKDVKNCGACKAKCIAPPYATASCYGGKCEYQCVPGWKNCDGKWENGCETDVGKGLNNCGACKSKCIAPPYATASCYGGKCEYQCVPGWKNCDGKWENGCETDVGKDVNNCGACKSKCIAPPYATATCNNHKCEHQCTPGWKNCDGKWENGCETDVGKDVNNCNGCKTKCPVAPNSTAKCNNYKCESVCKPTFADCDKVAANGCESCVATDPNNCGACGTKCVAPLNAITKCNNHKCEHACKPGHDNCDGDWTNGCERSCGSDPSNCGTCGYKCPDVPNALTKCNGGKCDYTCKPGYFNCDGDWTNGCEGFCGSDLSNCGTCGNKCTDVPYAVTKCNGGKCEYTCQPGYNNCDGNWTNGCERTCDSDVNNCGTCGNKCTDVPYAVTKCNGGKCDYTCIPGYNNCDGDWANGCECTPDTDVNNCGGCGKKCLTPNYAGGEAKCTSGECETQSCKSEWKWDSKKSCCVDPAAKTCILFLCI